MQKTSLQQVLRAATVVAVSVSLSVAGTASAQNKTKTTETSVVDSTSVVTTMGGPINLGDQ